MKEKYIEIIEKSLSAYTNEHIAEYFEKVQREGLTEHGFARLTANIGILISHGIRLDLAPIFVEMMSFCCQNMPKTLAANDFSVREILFCLMALEKVRAFDIERIVWWKSYFIEIDRSLCYTEFAKSADEDLSNWALFTAVSEWMRKYNGLCDTEEFVELQLEVQLRRFDENGQYHDHKFNEHPHQPMVYDLVPRFLVAILLHFGYRGKYYEKLRHLMKKAAEITLNYVSVNGELPFGGRSNQFIHNEAMLISVLEFAANVFYEDGDIEKAKRFKAIIKLALENMELWLGKTPIHHVKNRFSLESKFGCESYAYFDKYMITTASNIYPAYLMCNEDIPCGEPDESPMTMENSKYFHKLFMRAGGYFAEFDINADPHYDCSGLGRLHKKDAPSPLCISVPCPKHPNYTITVENPADISLCPGFLKNGEWVFATEEMHTVVSHKTNENSAKAEIKCGEIKAEYLLDSFGMSITLSGEGELAFMLPAFVTDGENESIITVSESTLDIEFGGYICRYSTSGCIEDLGRKGGNRNGIYHAYFAKGGDGLKVKIEIFKK